MKTLIVSSSLSKNSKSYILCRAAEDALREKGVDVELVDAREIDLVPCHGEKSASMEALEKQIAGADNYIIGMGVHCYSVSDGLKILLDTCFSGAKGKFFGVLCAAGTAKSYLATMHLTQICMNEYKMMQLPRTVYVVGDAFEDGKIVDQDIEERMNDFVDEFTKVGEALIQI